ncbi:unnamed protein product [Adineta steineri]|uniref:Ankyrin repeat protein n=1 Tax=Adineta steineri TaxID=433720 RepID=A0A815RJD2_9BILA|nr:unnamed protein product [Adineta steineri]
MPGRQFIYTRNDDFEELKDADTETLQEIATACESGSVHQLEAVLNSLNPDKLSGYLNALTYFYTGGDKKYLTPLMIASVHGQDSIIRLLLQNYSNVCLIEAQNYTSSYDFDYDYYDEHFNKQTALWLAVENEHLNVVQTLVSLGKANVNHRADYSYHDTNWTPLGIACCKGQLEMVKYLIENGADLYNADSNDSTSLMIACKNAHYDIVQYLLSLENSNNQFLNATNNEGSTALHKAACGRTYFLFTAEYSRSLEPAGYVDRTLDIVKLLLTKYQVKIVKDNDGYTPLTKAGINNQEELIKYFINTENNSWYTLPQVIDELELIGSYHMIWSYRDRGLEKAYHYFLWAMKLRYGDSQVPILKKNLRPSAEAYEHCTECQTIEELTSIKGARHRVIIEALMIWERLALSSSFLYALDHQAEEYNNNSKYQCALQLYLHAYHLRIETQIDLNKCKSCLSWCVVIMSRMISDNRTEQIQFNTFLKVLQATENEFLRNKNLPSTLNDKEKQRNYIWSSNETIPYIKKYKADKCLYIILNLLFIGTEILKCSDEKEKQQRQKVLLQQTKQLVDSNYRTIADNKTLLHLSAMQSHNSVRIGNVTTFPSLPVVQLLLNCRAPINAVDYYNNTPLYQLAANTYRHFDYYEPEDYTDEEMDDIEIIFRLFIDADAHLDAVTHQGKTPEDYAKHMRLKNLFQRYPIEPNLKCLCARMIRTSKLNYTNHISQHLQSFVQLH